MSQNLLDKYCEVAATLSEKDKAILERRIWTEVKKSKNYNSYAEWVKDVGSALGLTVNKCQNRMFMINRGDWVDPLWKKIDGKDKMPLTTGIRLLRRAKTLSAELGITNTESLQRVLDEYENDEDTILATSADGRLYRKKKPTTKVDIPKQNGEDWELDVRDAKKLWALLDAALDRFLVSRLRSLDESIRGDLKRDFVFQVRVVYEDFMKEVKRYRRDAKRKAIVHIGAHKLRQACEALNVPAPKPGDPVNIDEIKVRYRRLAARFHPDRNHGKDDMIKQYHAVNEALETIKMYMENLDG